MHWCGEETALVVAALGFLRLFKGQLQMYWARAAVRCAGLIKRNRP